MTWLAIATAILFLAIAAALVLHFVCNSAERRKQAQLAAIRDQSMRARIEIDQAALGFHRAMTEAVARYKRDHT